MPTVADVLRQHGGAYLERFGPTMPAEHKKVLRALCACRTGELGTIVYQCVSCGQTHAMGRSCGNRHCPTCQQGKAKAWLEKQTAALLPCPYFLLTFTVPQGLRAFLRAHQRVAYAALFQASSEALKKLAADPKHLGSRRCGFFGVLHTWGRTLDYHPHVHYVVPGGALSKDGSQWRCSRIDFFLPVRALSIVFRAKFRDAMKQAGLYHLIDPAVWKQDWVVHSRPAGDGRASLKYLAPYVFRVALSDRRIVSFDDQSVTFSYRKSGSNRWRKMTLEAMQFIRRFLQHVLPVGFQKIRHYGFLSPNSRSSVEAVRWLVRLANGQLFVLLSQPQQTPICVPRLCCAHCGGLLRLIDVALPATVCFFDTS
jgi:Putative transposase/Transposase zinc-binding domain